MKHIQKTGLKTGQWVNCNAKYLCRNQEKHYAQKEIEYATEYFRDKNQLDSKASVSKVQMKEFTEKFGNDVLLYRRSKIPRDNIDGYIVNFPEMKKRNRFSGEVTTVRNGSYIHALLKTYKEAEKKDIQIEMIYDDGAREILTPSKLEELQKTYKNAGKYSKFSDIAKIQFWGDGEKALELVNKNYARIDKLR